MNLKKSKSSGAAPETKAEITHENMWEPWGGTTETQLTGFPIGNKFFKEDVYDQIGEELAEMCYTYGRYRVLDLLFVIFRQSRKCGDSLNELDGFIEERLYEACLVAEVYSDGSKLPEAIASHEFPREEFL